MLEGEVMTESAEIEITGQAFAKRLANLVIAKREERGVSLRQLVAQSHGAVTKAQLVEIEAGTAPLDDELIDVVAELYGVDLATILPLRLPVSVGEGYVVAGGVSAAFTPDDPDSLLVSYLRLVRRMRKAERAPVVDLRREDIDALAAYLKFTGDAVVERLGSLMGASRSQRYAMAALFASGAVVIGLVGGATAAGIDATPDPGVAAQADSLQVVEVDAGHDAFRVVVVSDAEVDGDEVALVGGRADRAATARREQERQVVPVEVPAQVVTPVPAVPNDSQAGSSEQDDLVTVVDEPAPIVDPVTNEVGPPPAPVVSPDTDGTVGDRSESPADELVPAEPGDSGIEQDVGPPPVAPAADVPAADAP